MRTRSRKSSARVTLVLLGAAALAGCGSGEPAGEMRRALYASKDDCVADWGDPKDCEEQPASTSGGGSRRIWYGPYYHSGAIGSAGPRVGRSIGSQTITRGGFGASGHAHSSGGS